METKTDNAIRVLTSENTGYMLEMADKIGELSVF